MSWFHSIVLERLLLIFGVLMIGGLPLGAQDTRADTASRTAAVANHMQMASSSNKTFTAQTESDLGEQLPVSVASGGIGAYLIADTGLFYTSNPTLARGGSQGDMYFLARGGGGIHPNIFGGLYLDAHVSEEVFEYARNTSLDFNRFNTGGGLDYVFESLGQLTASVRYEYERFLNGGQLTEFYVNNAITTSLTKQFLLNDVHALQVGVNGSFSVSANPESSRRDIYDLWLGWRWRIIQPLELQTYYIVSIYNYPNDARTDVTQNVGGSLTYSFTPWAKVSASGGFGGNASTNAYYDYTVVNLGGTLSLDIRF